MKTIIKTVFLFVLISFSAKKMLAQPDAVGSARMAAYVDTLNALGDSLIQSNDVNIRIACGYAMIKRLVNALKTEGSFHYPFDSLRHISLVEPSDHSFRIFTWHIEMNGSIYRQVGAIQIPVKSGLKLIPLIDGSQYIENPMDTTLSPDLWYGSVYYNVIRKKYKGVNHYYLFGFDANDAFSNKKVIDVLTFSRGTNDQVIFGAPVFITDSINNIRSDRFIIEYSKDASAGLNYYDEYGKIIFDHLIPQNPLSDNVKSSYIPDGTYEGFRYSKGSWFWIEKVFHQAINENDNPPMPKPIDFDKEYPDK